MLPYWFMLSLAVGGLAFFGAKKGGVERWAWLGVLLVYVLMTGLRHEVGGDWRTYSGMFRHISRSSFIYALEFSDPGYYGLSWVVAKLGGDIYWLNTLCGLMVVAGVGIFCRPQQYAWLGLAVAVPYLLIVVGMGYTRQAAALGWALMGLHALGQRRNVGFVVPVLIGATFHKSAVLLLPIAALAASRSRLWTWIWVGVTTVLGAQLLLLEHTEHLWNVYVEEEMESQGGQIRVAMNAVPAVLFLLFRRKISPREGERRLWTWLSLAALACVPLVAVASTAVDRVALYFIPLQMFVFSRLHQVVRKQSAPFVLTGVVLYYAAVQAVWLNFATHADYWVPHQMLGLYGS